MPPIDIYGLSISIRSAWLGLALIGFTWIGSDQLEGKLASIGSHQIGFKRTQSNPILNGNTKKLDWSGLDWIRVDENRIGRSCLFLKSTGLI